MTPKQRLYAASATLLLLGLITYATDHEKIGMAGIVIGALVGVIGWRKKR